MNHWFGIIAGIIIIILDFALFLGKAPFFFLIGIGVVIALLPFLVTLMIETGRERNKEEMFLELCRNLSENISAGIPISKSIINVGGRSYGSLTFHIRKLANQISLGIPLRQAFRTFALDSGNKVIKKSVDIIVEAEQSGGEIGSTLESVAQSVNEVENVKKERRSNVYNQIVQGYIIFFIFIVIMLILQLWLLPQMEGIVDVGGLGSSGVEGIGGFGGSTIDSMKLMDNILFALILIESFFTGLVIGKLSEGSFKSGLRHSAILVILGYLIITGVRIFRG